MCQDELDFISASSRMSDGAEEPKLDVETAVFYDTLLVLAEVGWFTFDARKFDAQTFAAI